jgi:hypothetical protein
MCGLAEAVLRGHALRPRLHGIRFDLHREAAGSADQVVVMVVGAAGPVQALAFG